MKKPNYGQQQRMKTLDPVALAAYCKEKGLEMPQTVTPVAQVMVHPHEPQKPEPEVVINAPSGEEVAATVTTQEPSVTTSVTMSPAVETKPDEAQVHLTAVANRFFDLKDRLIQNAAHSVLNWDEIADLDAMLQDHRRVIPLKEVIPAVVALPAGQKWAIVVGEPMNRTQKFIRFQDDGRDAPYKILHVQYSQQRFMGRKVRVKENQDNSVGGYVLA